MPQDRQERAESIEERHAKRNTRGKRGNYCFSLLEVIFILRQHAVSQSPPLESLVGINLIAMCAEALPIRLPIGTLLGSSDQLGVLDLVILLVELLPVPEARVQ
jgi:hypothetical protein